MHVPWRSADKPAGARRKRSRLYRSLCAVKLLLAALRSSLTVLALPGVCAYVLRARSRPAKRKMVFIYSLTAFIATIFPAVSAVGRSCQNLSAAALVTSAL